MKKILILILVMFATGTAYPQINLFVPNQILTAQALNGAFGLYLPLTGGVLTGPLTVPSIVIGGVPFTPGGTTGTGAVVLNNSPVLITPNLGVPSFIDLTNAINLPFGSLPLIPANSSLANNTGASATPVAVPLPSCSSPTNALQWHTNTGYACSNFANPGSNTNITSLSGLTTPLSVGQGGTGLATLAQYNVMLGNGTGAVSLVGPSSTGTIFASTGVSSYPSFQTVSSLGLATLASPTFTGTPAAPTATTGTNTTQLATTAFVTSSPTLNTPTINGVTNGSSAPAGVVGQILSNSTTGTSITSGATVNATSISLTAGSWVCWGNVTFLPVTSTVITGIAAGITTTSVTLPALPNSTYLGVTLTTGSGGATTLNPTLDPVNVSSTTTLYLVAESSSVTGSTASVNGYLICLRTH